jgi:hypothetical protein
MFDGSYRERSFILAVSGGREIVIGTFSGSPELFDLARPKSPYIFAPDREISDPRRGILSQRIFALDLCFHIDSPSKVPFQHFFQDCLRLKLKGLSRNFLKDARTGSIFLPSCAEHSRKMKYGSDVYLVSVRTIWASAHWDVTLSIIFSPLSTTFDRRPCMSIAVNSVPFREK